MIWCRIVLVALKIARVGVQYDRNLLLVDWDMSMLISAPTTFTIIIASIFQPMSWLKRYELDVSCKKSSYCLIKSDLHPYSCWIDT